MGRDRNDYQGLMDRRGAKQICRQADKQAGRKTDKQREVEDALDIQAIEDGVIFENNYSG